MYLSDSTAIPASEWKPLLFDDLGTGGSESDPKGSPLGEHPDREFKMLYDASEAGTGANRFTPLYAMADFNCGSASENDDAEPDTETLRQQAYEEGLAKGEEKGYGEGLKKAEPVVTRMQELLAELEGLWHHLVQTYEAQIIDLVGRAAEKVVLSHVSLDHETIKRSIQQAFGTIPEPVSATIEVNPKEMEYIETLKEDFFTQAKSLKHVSLIPNASVNPGGCRIKTDTGEVDATVESRLDAVRQSIMDVIRGKAADAG